MSETKHDYNLESLEIHRKHRGKLEIVGTVPLETRDDLSRAYTPGVAAVCLAIAKDSELAYSHTIKGHTIAVVSDGTAVLGLGNIGGLAGIPVMEGKAAIFKRFGGLDTMPICLASQDVETTIMTVKNIAPVLGGVNLEDFKAPECFEIERRLRAELDIPVMHDDQHGTAVVALAGLINALKIKKLEAADARVVICGAGAAGTAIAYLLLEYGFRDIVVLDTKGTLGRHRRDLNSAKVELAAATNPRGVVGGLADALVGADIFLGVSAPKIATAEMISRMRPNPIVFAMSNPTPEIMPDEARTGGALIVGTGRSDFPNQVNNALAFPGIFRGALANRIRQFERRMFVAAARTIAGYVTNPTPDHLLPILWEDGDALSARIADVIR